MVEAHLPELDGEQIRYNDDTWEFTGAIDVKQNGNRIHAAAKKPDRVRGNTGTLNFTLDDPPASLNPGNLGDLRCELEQEAAGPVLVVDRNHTADRYTLDSLSYD
ncbi:hypothetical protein [Natronococcus sp.]|uniref:hypothetical protein n=1 Tax=Natronococcus sp. TaxID=35747 RepID=UPI003A4DE837